MSLDDYVVNLPDEATREMARRRLEFGRVLVRRGWVNETSCPDSGAPVRLPPLPIRGQPTFPMARLPERVDGA